MNKSDSIADLATALNKARNAFEPIRRSSEVKVQTRTGSSYTFKYAPLEALIGATDKALRDNGLTVLQDVRDNRVHTMLIHTSGQWLESSGTPIVNAEQSTRQEYGAGLTYSRRYDYSAVLHLCADDDTDGHAPTKDADLIDHKPAVKGSVHKPTDGARDNLNPEQQQRVTEIAGKVAAWIAKGKIADAVCEMENAGFDADEKTFCWTFFDSKERSVMKREHERQAMAAKAKTNDAELATQA